MIAILRVANNYGISSPVFDLSHMPSYELYCF